MVNTYMEFLSPKKKIRETNFLGSKKSPVEWEDSIDSFVLRCLNFLKYLVSTRPRVVFMLLKMKQLVINYSNFRRGVEP